MGSWEVWQMLTRASGSTTTRIRGTKGEQAPTRTQVCYLPVKVILGMGTKGELHLWFIYICAIRDPLGIARELDAWQDMNN